jgi:uncharacterized protein GlcG (DUF336 family)
MKQRLLATLMLLAVPAAAEAQGLPSQKYLPLAVAQEAANAATEACAAKGYKESVVVVDADGLERVVLRADGAGPHTTNSAFRKAYTAVTFGRPSSAWKSAVAQNPEIGNMQRVDNVMFAGGGLPIKAGADLVGAIGAAGAPGFDKDQACAQAGLDKIKARLSD